MNQHVYTNGILIEQTIDHGDGTGTRTTFDVDGNGISTETVEMSIQLEPKPTPEDRIDTLEQLVRAQAGTIDQLVDALGDKP